MLDHTLDQMEHDGLASRTLLPTDPPSFGWGPTPLGRSLTGPVAALAAWALISRTQLPATALRRAARAYPIARRRTGPAGSRVAS